ncbi:lipoyl(octanoyl) transferase LipB [Nonomuraea sp. KC401]|uniref:Octanoyltransferase n=1 Tax=Nonomuraea longispora TaxID=1848320 RepID=A0A4R4NQI9_9ACTN|nr:MULTISPECIES: lipoyl(octanoyl) transferase LipB [Nonomuraea]NBE93839.1 lipoyl(octanoyl) transferase LipB [Nonomuraea sp. K271]TDC10193.1 lipoyl(octanoyl) transferase LipB [Nonomuraea longispora]TLF80659.1 lipoyl(octanoyl) transferase LipB [Nonomuraea sp. KC401]
MRPIHGDDPHALAIVRLGVDVPYEQAWSLQRWVHDKRVAGALTDTVLLLEHAPVYTAGKRTAPHERPADGTPVIDVDRGGRLTWHGPGQLVAYPIVAITDVVAYACRLEDVMIQICADFGVTARRIRGRGGVWAVGDPTLGLPDRQLGAVGLRVTRGVTMHGFALNCANDPRWFNRIAPCGIPGVGVSSLSAETGRRIVVEEVMPIAEKRLAEALGMEPYDLHEEDLLRR